MCYKLAMSMGFHIGLIAVVFVFTMLGLLGFSLWYGSEAWSISRDGSRRQRIGTLLWVLYLFVLGGTTGIETLGLVPTRPELFVAIYGGVLVAGAMLTAWFRKPTRPRGWAAGISIALLAISGCILIVAK
jgi:hypothetical protein